MNCFPLKRDLPSYQKGALPGSTAPVLPILFRPCQYLSNEHPIKVLTWCEALADSTNLIYTVYLAHLKPLGQQAQTLHFPFKLPGIEWKTGPHCNIRVCKSQHSFNTQVSMFLSLNSNISISH